MPDEMTRSLSWWKRTTVYQIYPRSFKDSTGNGIGDLQGIISKLDYLQNLGVETIWFSPFFSSPQADHGYDVSDYRSIASEYGTMADCDRLIQEIHNRDMYVVFDMVLNHTSDQHPWFLESRSARENPKRDWYIWRDGKKLGGEKPPTNWKAIIGGSGWHYDDLTDQWYWAQFLPFQPDLNYRNSAVKQEMFDTLRFWLDKGVDGFRLDIINTVYEDESLRDNPFTWKMFPSEEHERSFFQNRIHTISHPDNFTFVKELRALMDTYSNPERFLVGEITASLEVLKKYSGEQVDRAKTDGLHMTFQFQSLNADFNANSFRDLIYRYEQFFPEPHIPTWVFSNHDQKRRISKLGNDSKRAKLNATLQLTARGVPFIYYGEEIGMFDSQIPLKRGQDPIARRYSWIPQWLVNILTKRGSITINRDNCRTPMQWTSSPNAGFCSAEVEPWLPVLPSHEDVNVDAAEKDASSILHCYRSLLRLRRFTPALHSGTMHLIDQFPKRESVLTYDRKYNDQLVRVLLNFSNDLIQIEDVGWHGEVLFSTSMNSHPFSASSIRLEPFQGIVLDLKTEDS